MRKMSLKLSVEERIRCSSLTSCLQLIPQPNSKQPLAVTARRSAVTVIAFSFVFVCSKTSKVQLLFKHDTKPASLLVTSDSVINTHFGFMCERKAHVRARSKVRVT